MAILQVLVAPAAQALVLQYGPASRSWAYFLVNVHNDPHCPCGVLRARLRSAERCLSHRLKLAVGVAHEPNANRVWSSLLLHYPWYSEARPKTGPTSDSYISIT